jgi:hypothetical protein
MSDANEKEWSAYQEMIDFPTKKEIPLVVRVDGLNFIMLLLVQKLSELKAKDALLEVASLAKEYIDLSIDPGKCEIIYGKE